MKYDSLILDVDGTIWNTTPIVAEAWNKAIDKNFPQLPHVTAEILQGQFGKTMNIIADNLFIGLNQDEKKILMEECCREEQIALHANTKNITYPGLVETIEKLAAKIPLFIVSNCQKGYIEVVIEKNGIQKWIKDFECYGNNGKNKDENIILVVERNNLKNPAYVGDTQGDCDACKKAGLPFIWAAYGFGKADEYAAKINSFSELLNLID
ncbi:MAG: HAD family hydrolase [Treponema sp.]|nr:HAD family hydrolase [Treponema sp.]